MSTLTQVSPLVLLKHGHGPPMVIAHGLCGTIQVSQLANHIQTAKPVYGLQAMGVDGKEEPLESIEEMAAYYVQAIENLDSDCLGIIGYSFGGLIALEMAQRLTANGRKILLLALLDAYPHPRFLNLPIRMSLLLRRLRTHLRLMGKMPSGTAWGYVWKGIKRRLRIGNQSNSNSPNPDSHVLRVQRKSYKAYARYQPRYYAGKVSFVTAELKTFFPDDPRAVWKDLVGDLEVKTVRGDHLSIVTTDFEPLAAVLTRFIEKADAQLRPRLVGAGANVQGSVE